MKSKIKKALIITSSAIVLFFGVFFMTRSLNNIVQSSNKSDISDVNETSSKDNSNTEDKVQVSNDSNTAKTTNEEPSTTQSTINSTPEKYTDYVVQKGDTLYSIARKAIPWKSQEEAVKIIETMNNLKDREVIVSGLRLMVPVNTIDTTNCIKYTVQAGETLYNIAEEYLPTMDANEAVQVIMQKNSISNPDLLSVGLEIYIPEGDGEVE